MENIFPKNFLWGASTSPHQVEGNNTHNDWWQWEISGRTEPSGSACDHYNKFREDFALAKQLGHNTHRLGLEWSRLEKENGIWDQNEWEHYKLVIGELLSLGIEPIVTLNHFTVPSWFSDIDGWTNTSSIELFTRFAVKSIETLGDKVRFWIPFNEPNILAILAYFYGQWPPAKKNFDEALIVLRNMLKSHALSYVKMHEYAKKVPSIKPPKIGIAKAVTAFHPCSYFSLHDRSAVYQRSRFHNHAFIRSAINGRVLIPGLPKERLYTKNAIDFIGLNYYFRQFIKNEEPLFKRSFGEVCSLSHHPEAGPVTDMGWEIYPKGLYETIKAMSRYGKPIIITENGLATKNDSLRQDYIRHHLGELLTAIRHGFPVIGYLHWSLLDNFEWAEGYSKRFGLIEVDYASQKRSIRPSAKYYASVIRTGQV
ncbi:MAG: glycoside hydrolase family 1 protein [Candidatus Omnitrophota bacterium]